MSGEYIDFECAGCKKQTQTQYGDEEVNDDGLLICEDCAGPMQWGDLEFPLWIEEEVRLDDWRLADLVMYEHDLPIDEVPGRDLKCNVFHVWFKVDEEGNVEGPYDEKLGKKI